MIVSELEKEINVRIDNVPRTNLNGIVGGDESVERKK